MRVAVAEHVVLLALVRDLLVVEGALGVARDGNAVLGAGGNKEGGLLGGGHATILPSKTPNVKRRKFEHVFVKVISTYPQGVTPRKFERLFVKAITIYPLGGN